MKHKESLNKIVLLLKQLEGVDVIDTDCTSNRMAISLTIESHLSHFWLEYCAEAANVSFRCYSKYYPWDEEAISNPSSALIFNYSIVKDSDSVHDFENFNYLGSFLVWTMHYFKLIETDEANSLLDFWGSVHVGKKLYFTNKTRKPNT